MCSAYTARARQLPAASRALDICQSYGQIFLSPKSGPIDKLFPLSKSDFSIHLLSDSAVLESSPMRMVQSVPIGLDLAFLNASAPPGLYPVGDDHGSDEISEEKKLKKTTGTQWDPNLLRKVARVLLSTALHRHITQLWTTWLKNREKDAHAHKCIDWGIYDCKSVKFLTQEHSPFFHP